VIARDEILAEARSWIGERWRHQGRGPRGRGVDCGGVIVCVAQGLQISNYDISGYRRMPPTRTAFLEHFEQNMMRLSAPVPAAVGVFRNETTVIHCGIFSEKYGRLHIIEANASIGRVIEAQLTKEQRSTLVGIFDYPGVEPWAG